MLRRIFGPKSYDITEEWRKLRNKEFDDLYSLPNIIRLIKLRELDGRGFITYGGEVYKLFWWGNLKERDHLEYPGADRRIILRWIFRKCDGSMEWIDLAQDRNI